MRFELTILGSNSATPSFGRHLTAQVLGVRERLFLIDCGESTQFQLMRLGIKHQRIQQIFISHLHGDHIFGLIGLLMTWGLNQRVLPVAIYSPQPEVLRQIIEVQTGATNTQLPFEVEYLFANSETSELVYENAFMTVHSIPLRHRVPTTGYLFREKEGLLRLRREQLLLHQVPLEWIERLKQGEDFIKLDGSVIPNADLTLPPPHPRSYAFCSDTMYHEPVIDLVRGVDMLYHEATFLHALLTNAEQTMHSTALQAATIAQAANVQKLLLGHFSARYDGLEELEAEAKTVFAETYLATDEKIFSVPYDSAR